MDKSDVLVKLREYRDETLHQGIEGESFGVTPEVFENILNDVISFMSYSMLVESEVEVVGSSILQITSKRMAQVILDSLIEGENKSVFEYPDLFNGFESGEYYVYLYRFVEELVTQSQLDFDWCRFPTEVQFYEDYTIDTSYIDEDRLIFVHEGEFDSGYEIHVDDYSKYLFDPIKKDKIVFGWIRNYSVNEYFRPTILVISGVPDIEDIEESIFLSKHSDL